MTNHLNLDLHPEAQSQPLPDLALFTILHSVMELSSALRIATESPRANLFPFQHVAALQLAATIRRCGGGILADEVGLGKSHTALAVARILNQPTTILAPPALLPQWRDLIRHSNPSSPTNDFQLSLNITADIPRTPNPSIPQQHPSPTVISHHALLRRDKMVSHGLLPHPDQSTPTTHQDPTPYAITPQLLIVDEAHHFRNRNTKRYVALQELTSHHPCLLLTATPTQNRTADVIHLLQLFLTTEIAQTLAASGDDPWATHSLSRVLLRTCIARTREQAININFAVQQAQRERHALPTLPQTVLRLLGPDRIHGTFSPSTMDPERVAPIIHSVIRNLALDGEPAKLFELGFLRRLASSTEAAAHSLRRARNFLEHRITALRSGRDFDRHSFNTFLLASTFHTGCQTTFDFWYPEANGQLANTSQHTVESLSAQCEALSQCISDLEDEPTLTSPKLRAVANIITNAQGPVLLFTEFTATTAAIRHALVRSLQATSRTYTIYAATGGHAHVNRQRVSSPTEVISAFRQAAEAFFKGARATNHTPSHSLLLPLPVLVLSPIGAEGLNLQCVSDIIHADLPWNPSKLEQRVGRADRIGGLFDSLRIHTFHPHPAIESRLQLLNTIAAKARVSQSILQILHSQTPALNALLSLTQPAPTDSRDLIPTQHLPPSSTITHNPLNNLCRIRTNLPPPSRLNTFNHISREPQLMGFFDLCFFGDPSTHPAPSVIDTTPPEGVLFIRLCGRAHAFIRTQDHPNTPFSNSTIGATADLNNWRPLPPESWLSIIANLTKTFPWSILSTPWHLVGHWPMLSTWNPLHELFTHATHRLINDRMHAPPTTVVRKLATLLRRDLDSLDAAGADADVAFLHNSIDDQLFDPLPKWCLGHRSHLCNLIHTTPLPLRKRWSLVHHLYQARSLKLHAALGTRLPRLALRFSFAPRPPHLQD